MSGGAPVITERFHYSALLLDDAGRALGEQRIEPDWGPAVSSAHLEGIRRGGLPALTDPGPFEVRPRWDRSLGAPWIAGVEVRLTDVAGGAPFRFNAPLAYFADYASAVSAELIASGQLQPGELFRYRINAFPVSAAASPAGVVIGPTPLRSRREPLAIADASIAALLAQAEPAVAAEGAEEAGGEDGEDRDQQRQDVPVMLPRSLLDEAAALAARDPEVESGGILVGRLLRDTDSRELAIAVTALIPARHTEAKHESLRFTPRTWQAADAAIALRAREETMIGWFHSHPFFCRRCDSQRRRRCPLSRPIFSSDDRQVHRAAFPRAWQVALLGSFLGDVRPQFHMFGWRRGSIVARAFLIVDAPLEVHEEETQ